MAKLGFFIPRTLSNALSTQREDNDQAFYVSENTDGTPMDAEQRIRRRPGWSRSGDTLPQRVVRIGRSIIPSGHGSGSTSRATSQAPVPLSAPPTTGRGHGEGHRKVINNDSGDVGALQPEGEVQRTIRFPDEAQLAANKVQAE
tara:strand:+ start:30987 stop:31418 length:432 start_codon:yes stop_codon:yes gene_type:complete